ncbi:hypothetical protein [Winogradskyella sp.]|uniref:hypothetical protein n=1 Tax=Winogradskyella sp. TaxID=1883156 RepID=UPI0035164116
MPKYLPPLPPDPPDCDGEHYSKAIVIELKNNSIYFNSQKVDHNELEQLLKDSVINQNPIISLYDLNSNYGDFLKMNLAISNAFYEQRQILSLTKFNKNYSDLDKEEISEIKQALPMRHIWDYSIPHYNEVIKKDGTFFGFLVR